MTNRSPIFAYPVFSPGGVSFERLSRPTKASVCEAQERYLACKEGFEEFKLD
jgi:hypothetical protein